MPGFPELLVILIILVIVFGAQKLPALGEAIGKMMVNLKKPSTDDPSALADSNHETKK